MYQKLYLFIDYLWKVVTMTRWWKIIEIFFATSSLNNFSALSTLESIKITSQKASNYQWPRVLPLARIFLLFFMASWCIKRQCAIKSKRASLNWASVCDSWRHHRDQCELISGAQLKIKARVWGTYLDDADLDSIAQQFDYWARWNAFLMRQISHACMVGAQ